MINSLTKFALVAIAIMPVACSTKKTAEVVAEPEISTISAGRPMAGTAAMMPKAVVYKTSAPSADLVPVQLNDKGELVSFPAPSDLTANSTPLPLTDGFWLDRRGITATSAFTRWTYAEYRAMKQAPSPAEILNNINPAIKVTTVMQLPMTLTEAEADTAVVNAIITKRLNPELILKTPSLNKH